MGLLENKKFGKTFILDGSYFLHRALAVESVMNLRNSKGEGTGGIFGVLRMLLKEISLQDRFPILVFDSGLAPRRLAVYPDYKHASDPKEETVLSPEEAKTDHMTQYREQRNKLVNLLPMLGIPVVKIKGWEGDDLMYIISRLSYKSTIVTDDKDLLQMLSSTCKIRRAMADKTILCEDFLKEREFDTIEDFIWTKAICGDGSDNITGCCQGVAEGSSNHLIKILKHYYAGNKFPEDEKELRDLCNELGCKYKKAFLNFDENIFKRNLQLVDLRLVENDIDEQIVDSIISTISDCKARVNLFGAMKLLNDYEIKDFSASSMIEKVNSRYSKLFV